MSTHEPTATIIISSKKARHGLPENKLPPVHLAAQQHFRPTIVTRLKQPAPKRPLLGRRPFYLARQQAKLKSFDRWFSGLSDSTSKALSHPAPLTPSKHLRHTTTCGIIFFFSLLTVVSRFVVGSYAGSWGGDGSGRGVFYNNTPAGALETIPGRT